MKEIKLTKGLVALVDDVEYEELSKYKWSWGGHYAMRKDSNGKTVYLHRQILNAPKDMQVDHINRDRLDNRRQNLRIVTKQQNLLNVGLSKHNTSGFKGVSWCNKKQLWRVFISVGNKSKYLGSSNNKVEAARIYNEAAKSLRGEYAVLNNV
jgi:hypothetical protein